MRKLILKISISLDGFVAGPNGELDWIFPSTDQGATIWTLETVWQAGLHVMGRKTFQDMASFWPYSSEPFAAPMNAIPKLVFGSQGLAPAELSAAVASAKVAQQPGRPLTADEVKANLKSWQAPFVASDLAGEIASRKQEPGKDLIAYGGASFAQSLVKLGLVDEYRLMTHPVALGRGLPLFSTLCEPKALSLISSTTFPSGAVARIYQPA